jgi:hypothetical protein
MRKVFLVKAAGLRYGLVDPDPLFFARYRPCRG